MIGLAAASDEVVMAILILAGEELSFEQKTGHNIRAEHDDTKCV